MDLHHRAAKRDRELAAADKAGDILDRSAYRQVQRLVLFVNTSPSGRIAHWYHALRTPGKEDLTRTPNVRPGMKTLVASGVQGAGSGESAGTARTPRPWSRPCSPPPQRPADRQRAFHVYRNGRQYDGRGRNAIGGRAFRALAHLVGQFRPGADYGPAVAAIEFDHGAVLQNRHVMVVSVSSAARSFLRTRNRIRRHTGTVSLRRGSPRITKPPTAFCERRSTKVVRMTFALAGFCRLPP